MIVGNYNLDRTNVFNVYTQTSTLLIAYPVRPTGIIRITPKQPSARATAAVRGAVVE